MIYIILEIESYIDRMRHIITQFHLFIFDSSMKWQLNLEEETTPQSKERSSNNTNETQNQNIQKQITSNLLKPQQILRTDPFEKKISQTQISNKLNEKAVSWLQSNCWSKEMSLDSTLLSITLYYAYKSSLVIQKHRLELILGTCLFLSSKMMRSPQLSTQDIHELISYKFSEEEIILEEAKILELLDYDLNFTFTSHLLASDLKKQEMQKTNFLMQMLLLRDQTILFSVENLSNLVKTVRGKQTGQELDLRPLLKSKNLKVLIHKYNSKFQVQQFLKFFL